jgi:hypothetical protein
MLHRACIHWPCSVYSEGQAHHPQSMQQKKKHVALYTDL